MVALEAAAAQITCVIPTHARPEFLASSIGSVLSQSAPVAGVVVVSDDANPESRAVVDRLSRENPLAGLRYLDRSADGAPGVSESRNAGARSATTPWVAFLDDDDEWDTRLVATVAEALHGSGAELALIAMRQFDVEGTVRVIPVIPGLTVAEYLDTAVHEFARGGNVVVARRLFDALGGFDADLPSGQDVDFVIRALAGGASYVAIEEPLVGWRTHEGSRITSKAAGQLRASRSLLDRHSALMTRSTRRYYRFKIHRFTFQSSPSAAVKARALGGMAFNVTRHQLSWLKRELAARPPAEAHDSVAAPTGSGGDRP